MANVGIGEKRGQNLLADLMSILGHGNKHDVQILISARLHTFVSKILSNQNHHCLKVSSKFITKFTSN